MRWAPWQIFWMLCLADIHNNIQSIQEYQYRRNKAEDETENDMENDIGNHAENSTENGAEREMRLASDSKRCYKLNYKSYLTTKRKLVLIYHPAEGGPFRNIRRQFQREF